MAAPLIGASAVAARTDRIKVGLAVQVLPLASPIRIAEEAAIVEHASERADIRHFSYEQLAT